MSLFSRLVKVAGRAIDAVTKPIERALGIRRAPAPASPLPTIVEVARAEEEAEEEETPAEAREDLATALGPVDQGPDRRPTEIVELGQWLSFFEAFADHLPQGFGDDFGRRVGNGELDMDKVYLTLMSGHYMKGSDPPQWVPFNRTRVEKLRTFMGVLRFYLENLHADIDEVQINDHDATGELKSWARRVGKRRDEQRPKSKGKPGRPVTRPKQKGEDDDDKRRRLNREASKRSRERRKAQRPPGEPTGRK